MKDDQLLDSFERKVGSKFINRAKISLIASVFFLIGMFVFMIFGNEDLELPFYSILLVLGFVVSSIFGFINTIMSYFVKEDKSFYRTIISVGSLIILLILLGMIGLLVMISQGLII